MTRAAAIAGAVADLDEGRFLADLARRVAIPTESQDPDRRPELYRYLEEEMTGAFEALGYRCRIFDNPVADLGPVLLAERREDPALPTVLGYGHGDVVRGHAAQWRDGLSPWRLTEEGDRVYGRGTADNKGQHSVHLSALGAVLRTRGRLGFNSKFLIETGEETGSGGLGPLVKAHRARFAADVLIASDGPRLNVDRANLTLGCRGVMNFDLVCDLRDAAHHSGNWGGLLANPGLRLAHALATATTAGGRMGIDAWRPDAIPAPVRRALAGIEPDRGAGAPRVDPGWGEPGLTAAEKVFAWNTFEVLAYRTGDPDHPVNAIPPRAAAQCQIRYVAGSRPEEFLPGLRRHLDAHGFSDVAVRPPPPGNAGAMPASRTDPDDPWVEWVRGSIERTTGAPPAVLPNSAGSICNYVFRDHLALPTIWIPHSYGGCSQHAPDEHLLKSLTREALAITAGVYWDLGEEPPPARP